MGLLRLCGSGDLACADRPHGLVRNHDVAARRHSSRTSRHQGDNVPPVRRVLENVDDSLELFVDYLCRISCFPFREGFSDAEDDFEMGIERCLGLVPDQLGIFMEQGATLRVP